MTAIAKTAIQPAATPHESRPKLSVVVPPAEQSRGDFVSLSCMLLACAAFAGSFVFWILLPALRTLMGT